MLGPSQEGLPGRPKSRPSQDPTKRRAGDEALSLELPKGAAMDPVEEFRRHARDCRQMAQATRDLESKATWNGLAERWLRCAELEELHRAAATRGSAVRQQRKRAIYRQAS